jgi:RNA polymerase sigma-70 factor (ECF subfamily)
MPQEPDATRGHGVFATTHWSLVLRAGDRTRPESQQALESLCRAYWYPLYAFVRRGGYTPHQAEDSTQEFLARLLSGSGLAGVSQEKGRFRTFLLAAMKHFLADEWDAATRLKRGGGREFLSWDALEPEARYRLEPESNAPEEKLFDRQWALALVAEVLARLRAEANRDGTLDRFDALKGFLVSAAAENSYATAATTLGLSEAAVKSAIFRLRRRYGQILREAIANTVASPEEVDDEIRHLFASLAD